MENILSHLSADDLEIKLTEEKLFIKTAISNETFALRSINGIGVIDLIDEYNKALIQWKGYKNTANICFFFGGLFLFILLYGLFKGSLGVAIFCLFIASIFLYFGYIFNRLYQNEPILMSAVRIMMSGGNRDFEFDKNGVKSGNIAEFVANVESTLTAFHKKNQ